MKLRTLIDLLKTPSVADGLTGEEVLDLEVVFADHRGVEFVPTNSIFASIDEVESIIIVDIEERKTD